MAHHSPDGDSDRIARTDVDMLRRAAREAFWPPVAATVNDGFVVPERLPNNLQPPFGT